MNAERGVGHLHRCGGDEAEAPDGSRRGSCATKAQAEIMNSPRSAASIEAAADVGTSRSASDGPRTTLPLWLRKLRSAEDQAIEPERLPH